MRSMNITSSVFGESMFFSTDHKVIGIQCGICGLIFLFFGFTLMMLMRWQLAFPGTKLPMVGRIARKRARAWER